MPAPLRSLVDAAASRYFTRWTQAAPERPALVAQTADQPLDRRVLEQRLQASLDDGLGLPAAMRRLRNLVVCSLI